MKKAKKAHKTQGLPEGKHSQRTDLQAALPWELRRGDRLISGLLIVLLGALPFVWNPIAQAPTIDIYIGSKEIFAKVFVSLIIGAWIAWRLEALWFGRLGLVQLQGGIDRPLLYVVGLMVAVALLSVFVSSEMYYSWRAFLWILLLALLLLAVADTVREREARLLAVVITVAATVIAVQAILQYFDLDPFRGSVRTVRETMEMERTIVSTQIGQVTMAGSYLAMAIPIALCVAFMARSLRGRLLALGAFTLQVAGLVATSARGPLSGVMVGIPVFVAVVLYQRPSIWRRIWKAAAVLLLVSAVFVAMNPTLLQRTVTAIEKYQEGDYNAALNKRYIPWQIAWRIFGEHPLSGTGLGTFKFHYSDYVFMGIEEGILPENMRIGKFQHAHNEYLQILQEMGVVGLVGFAGGVGYWFFTVGHSLLRRRRDARDAPQNAEQGRGEMHAIGWDGSPAPSLLAACASSLAAFLIIGVTTPLFHFILTAVLAVVFMGTGYALARDGGARPLAEKSALKHAGIGIAKRAMIASGAILFVIAGVSDAAREFKAVVHQEAGLAVIVQFYQRRLPPESIQRQFAMAAEHLDRAVQLDPLRGGLYTHLGMLYTGTRQWDKAIAALEKAERYDKGNRGPIWTNLGRAYKEREEYAKAKSYYERVVKHYPRHAQAAMDGLNEIEFMLKVKGEQGKSAR